MLPHPGAARGSHKHSCDQRKHKHSHKGREQPQGKARGT